MLFRDGRELIKGGNIATGCDKLASSERLEPKIGTLLNLGDCREKLGKLASAWAAFREAHAMAERSGHDGKREAEAAKRAAALEPRMANLVIGVASRVDGLVVRRDNEVVDTAVWNTPIPVDPGTYTITAEAPGYLPWRLTVEVTGKITRQPVQIPALERAPVVAPAIEAPPQPRVTYVTTHRPRTWNAARGLALGLGIAGAGAIGTGLYFGFESRNLQDSANQRCPLTVCTDPEGLHQNAQAQTDATRANVLYAAGGVGVAAALVMWFVGAPGDETIVTPTFGGGQAGVSIKGTF